MPILEVFASVSPEDMKSFIKGLSSTFAEAIGKPEKACLVSFTRVDGYSLGGTDEPGFYAKVSSIGNIENDRNSNLTAAVTSEIEKHLDVSFERGYFIFADKEEQNIGYMKTTVSNLFNR